MEALASALPDVLNASVGELNFKNVVNKLGDVMYTFPFSLPPYYIAIIRCLGVLEGVAIQVMRGTAVPFSLCCYRRLMTCGERCGKCALLMRQSWVECIVALVNRLLYPCSCQLDRSCTTLAF